MIVSANAKLNIAFTDSASGPFSDVRELLGSDVRSVVGGIAYLSDGGTRDVSGVVIPVAITDRWAEVAQSKFDHVAKEAGTLAKVADPAARELLQHSVAKFSDLGCLSLEMEVDEDSDSGTFDLFFDGFEGQIKFTAQPFEGTPEGDETLEFVGVTTDSITVSNLEITIDVKDKITINRSGIGGPGNTQERFPGIKAEIVTP